MKVLVLVNHLNLGGISRYVFLLAKGLIALGNKVWIVGKGELEEEFKELGVEIIKLNLKIKSELSWRIPKAIFKLRNYFLKEKPDIIHANTRTNAIIAYGLSKIFDIPYVVTCHGLYKIRWTRRLFPFLGEYVIAISKEVERQLYNGLSVELSRIKLIYNGIDLEYFSYNKININKQDFGFKNDDFIIGNVSRLELIKGQDTLILAMPQILKEIPQAKLLLVGEGKARNFLEKKIRELNLIKNVFFFGALKDIRRALNIMDIFCFLPYYEPFGLSLLEAMAVGLPIIASSVSDLEFILDEAGILIPPGRADLLAKAVISLYRDREKRKELSTKAYERAKYFSYQNMVKHTLEVYEKATKDYKKIE